MSRLVFYKNNVKKFYLKVSLLLYIADLHCLQRQCVSGLAVLGLTPKRFGQTGLSKHCRGGFGGWVGGGGGGGSGVGGWGGSVEVG